MKTKVRTRLAALVTAGLVAVGAMGIVTTAQARHGADDPAGHVRHGADDPRGHDKNDVTSAATTRAATTRASTTTRATTAEPYGLRGGGAADHEMLPPPVLTGHPVPLCPQRRLGPIRDPDLAEDAGEMGGTCSRTPSPPRATGCRTT
jgi:hypothetical protein